MLGLDFAGWFQCRLATDPDPADEPRGVSGWTFAVGTEPDLDRVIRFQRPHAPREPGRPVGVTVRAVRVRGRAQPDHPLMNGEVELLDEAQFEGRNGLIAEDGHEPIHPFHLQVSGRGVTLRRKDVLDPDGRPIHQTSEEYLSRRLGAGLQTDAVAMAEVLEATGLDPDRAQAPGPLMSLLVGELERRKQTLKERQKEIAGDPDAVEALETRIRALDERIRPRRWKVPAFRVPYEFDIGAVGKQSGEVIDESGRLGHEVDLVAPWPVRFWMGGWDADSLCGFVKGTLTIPLR